MHQTQTDEMMAHSEVSLDHQLWVAASNGQLETVQNLLQRGAGFHADKDGRTALHHAALNGFADVCQLLIERGFDYDHQDNLGYVALQHAVSKGHKETVEVLVGAGCSLDKQDHMHGNAAIHEAGWNGFSKTLEVLVKSNANVFIVNKAGFTALHLVAQNGHNESARVLLYAGCNPDMKNNYGDTALHTAARYGHAGVSRILLSARCKINDQNKNGDTALHIAAALRRRKITKVLVDGGAVTNIRNKQNETAIDVAERKEHPDIISIIRSQPQTQPKLPSLYRSSKEDLEMFAEEQTSAPQAPDKKKKKFFFRRKKSKEKVKGDQPPQPSSACADKSTNHVSGFFSRYIHEDGFMYYKDLAGNIKQGPVGYTPVCQCAPRLQKLERKVEGDKQTLVTRVDTSHQLLHDRIDLINRRTNQQMKTVGEITKKRIDAEHNKCADRLKQKLDDERVETEKRLQAHDVNIRGDIQAWVETRISDYAHVNGLQATDDSGLYNRRIFQDVELYGGRLYRTRSDETLSQSDFSVRNKKKRLFELRRNPAKVVSSAKVSGRRKERDQVGDGVQGSQVRVSDQAANQGGGHDAATSGPNQPLTSTPNVRRSDTKSAHSNMRKWDTTNGQSYVRLDPGPVAVVPVKPGERPQNDGRCSSPAKDRTNTEQPRMDVTSNAINKSAKVSADRTCHKKAEDSYNLSVSAHASVGVTASCKQQIHGPSMSVNNGANLGARKYGDYARMPATIHTEANHKPVEIQHSANSHPPLAHSSSALANYAPYRNPPKPTYRSRTPNEIDKNRAQKLFYQPPSSAEEAEKNVRSYYQSHTPEMELRSVGRGRTTELGDARTRKTTSASPVGQKSTYPTQKTKLYEKQVMSQASTSFQVSAQLHNAPSTGGNASYLQISDYNSHPPSRSLNRSTLANRTNGSAKSTSTNTNHVRFKENKTMIDPVSYKPRENVRAPHNRDFSVSFRNDSPSREVMSVMSKSEPFLCQDEAMEKTRNFSLTPAQQNKEDSGSNRSNPDSGYSSRLYGNMNGYREMSPRISDLSTGTPSSSFSLEHNGTPLHFNSSIVPYPTDADDNNNDRVNAHDAVAGQKQTKCSTISQESTSSSSSAKLSSATIRVNPNCRQQYSVTTIDPLTNLRGTDV